jgi:hypothetical protein
MLDELTDAIPSIPPTDPDELELWLEARSQNLSNLITKELTAVVVEAYERFIASVELEQESLTAAGDLSSFDDIPPRWQMIADNRLNPHVQGTYLSGGMSAYTVAEGKAGVASAFASQWANVVNQSAINYLGTRQNLIVGVGQSVFNSIRDRTQNAIRKGLSVEKLKREVEQIAKFSEFRADMVARTETQTAYNAGNYAGQVALEGVGPTEKSWLATRDGRTRDSHALVNGVTLPIKMPFTVGSSQMQYPLDPAGAPKEVIQCRCVALYYYPGDARPDGSIVPDTVANQSSQLSPQVPSPQAPQTVQTGADVSQTRPTQSSLRYRKAKRKASDFEGEWDDIIEKGGGLDGSFSARGDLTLNELWRRQGFDARPSVVKPAQYDDLVTNKGWTKMHRGIAGDTAEQVDEFVNQFVRGDTPFAGRGMFGNGTYASRSTSTAQQFTKQNARGDAVLTGRMLDLAVHPKAKVIDIEDVYKGMRKVVEQERAARRAMDAAVPNSQGMSYSWVRERAPAELVKRADELANQQYIVGESPSNWATVNGYDVIRIRNPIVNQMTSEKVDDVYYIILNRGTVAVKETR